MAQAPSSTSARVQQRQPDPSAPADSNPEDENYSAKDVDEEEHAELTTFQCREAYVYRIPPASTIGHRAELWRVDNWDAEVRVTVVSCQEACWVRLLDKESGELFAECPIPKSQPLVTVVEPVVDSSRYYVIRIEDRSSRRHAFIGLGFRDRSDASDFNAALDDHLQHLRRKKAADAMRQQYYQARQARVERRSSGGGSCSDDGGGCGLGEVPYASDLALKPGETINVALPWATKGSSKTQPNQRMAAIAAQARAHFVPSSLPDAGNSRTTSGGAVSMAGLLLPPPAQRPTFSPCFSSAGSDSAVLGSSDQGREDVTCKPSFRPFEDSCSVAAEAPSPASNATTSSMRASFVLSQDRDESMSMAALSLKSVGSGGSSLVAPSSCCPSETGSDNGRTVSAPLPTAHTLASPVHAAECDAALTEELTSQSDCRRSDPPECVDADVENAAHEAGEWGDFVAS